MFIIEVPSWKRCLALMHPQALLVFAPGCCLSLREVCYCCTFSQVLATSLPFIHPNKTVVAWQFHFPAPLVLLAVTPRATDFKMQNNWDDQRVSLGQLF